MKLLMRMSQMDLEEVTGLMYWVQSISKKRSYTLIRQTLTLSFFYNDYSTENPVKREYIYKLIKSLREKGIPIHGVGLQCHISVSWPSV